MTNHEVNEYMQRFLDDDLNEEELQQLMEHIRLTPASAQLFERLQRLDSELEQLPKVIPPMSIVDSILPRLELAGLVDHPPLTGSGSTVELPNRSMPSAPRPTMLGRINYRVFGGVVAAGIALTLFITNIGPQMSFNTANDDAASSMNSIMMESSSQSQLENKDGILRSQQSDANPDAGAVNNKLFSEGAEAPTQNAEKAGALPLATETDSVAPMTSGAPMISDSASNAPMAKVAEDAPWVDQGKAMGFEAAQEPSSSEKMSVMLTSEAPDLPTVVSPNEQLTGKVTSVDDGGQHIIITDHSGAVVYESAVYKGKLAQLTWSPDSSQLHFEVVVDNQTTAHMTIHVSLQTESMKKAE